MTKLVITAALLLAVAGTASAGWLYAIDGDDLYSVDPYDGDWESLS